MMTPRASARVCGVVALAAVVAAALNGCSGSPPLEHVVIEGDLAPELIIRGKLYATATRDSWWCKQSRWQNPVPRYEHMEGKITRAGTHYLLSFDLDGVPQGGFCEWRTSSIMLEVAFAHGKQYDVPLGSLVPEHSFGPSSNLQYLPARQRVKAVCGVSHRHALDEPSCEGFYARIDDQSSTSRVQLDVAFDEEIQKF